MQLGAERPFFHSKKPFQISHRRVFGLRRTSVLFCLKNSNSANPDAKERYSDSSASSGRQADGKDSTPAVGGGARVRGAWSPQRAEADARPVHRANPVVRDLFPASTGTICHGIMDLCACGAVDWEVQAHVSARAPTGSRTKTTIRRVYAVSRAAERPNRPDEALAAQRGRSGAR